MPSLFLIFALIVFSLQFADADNVPKVEEEWIFTMITLGFISSFVLTGLIIGAVYKIYQRVKIHQKPISKALVALDFANWCFNAIACYEWAFLRTNLFIDLDVQKCTIIYVSNYLFYMLAKYCLHILLVYRLYIAFNNTMLKINSTYAKLFASIITIDFIVFALLWMSICFEHVSVGITVPSKTLQICTLYNNDSKAEHTIHHVIWPCLFGGQDFIVGIATLVVFIYKIHEVSINPHFQDIETEIIIRKSFILGSISICSTFIFYTFAVPFYPNLTFLLPFDVLINSLCVFLICDWSYPLYHILCSPCDIFFRTLFRYKNIKKENAPNSSSKINLDGVEIVFRYPKKIMLAVVNSHSSGKSLTDLRKYKHGRSPSGRSSSDPYAIKSLDPLPLSKSRFTKSSFF